MNKEDMILVSVDDHIVEPPDMFKNHLAKKYAAEAPRLVHNPDGSDTWQFRDVVIPNVALNAVAGRPKEEYGNRPLWARCAARRRVTMSRSRHCRRRVRPAPISWTSPPAQRS